MEGLSYLDKVAYVRFASVYKNFKEAKDFEQFVGNLDDNKLPHPASLHMGLPPEHGDKWILTFWFREKMVNKKDLKQALKPQKSKEKKQFDRTVHAKNVHEKFKELCNEKGALPL